MRRHEKTICQVIEDSVGISNRVAWNRLNEICVHSNIVVKVNEREAKLEDLRKGKPIAPPENSHPISHPAKYSNSELSH